MSAFLLYLLLTLPFLNAQRFQNRFKDDDELLEEPSVAASYLSDVPMRQYQHQLIDSSADRLSSLLTSDRFDQQRAKRIYWENLAFHATDYNQKPKKV